MGWSKYLCGWAVLTRERRAQPASELTPPAHRPRQPVQLRQVVLLGRLADRQAQPMTALRPPPALPLLRQVAPPQLVRPVPLQVAESHQASLHPVLHLRELPEAVAVQPERPLALFEEQLDLPPQVVERHHRRRRPA